MNANNRSRTGLRRINYICVDEMVMKHEVKKGMEIMQMYVY